jgi:soluble lytic murein transglycosylase-like protein
MLSALAGGGLTAAGLGGPLARAALGATQPGGSASAEAGGPQEGEAAQQPTSTSTTPTTPTETTATATATAPSAPAPSTTAPASTTTTPQAPPATPAAEAPTVVLKRKQKTTRSAPPSNPSATPTTSKGPGGKAGRASKKKAAGPNGVAASPQTVAAEAGALAALLASSEASAQALSFYRIPLFLLPIYKAAAVQYGVPWQILAAINEIETDYGTDLSVSSAGAVGWMQFMPATWLQYGVDALDAGYADPYNPVDAIFAAARYLRAAGAATNLRAAILAYNHSEEYVESVLLRAKLISSYPKAVIATLTGLTDGRLPASGRHLSWSELPAAALPSASSATANATPAASQATEPSAPGAPAAAETTAPAANGSTQGATSPASVPGATVPLSPADAAAAATSRQLAGSAKPTAEALQLVELLSAPDASVLAVQNGRIIHVGHSRKLGKYLVLRDVYGDVFTYAGLGSIAPSYVLPKTPKARVSSPVVEAASTRKAAPSLPASAGTHAPVTLQVRKPLPKSAGAHGQLSVQPDPREAAPPGMDKVRLFAHPGNPDARAAAVASAARKARSSRAGDRLPLRRGAVVAAGTVLGRVRVPPGARDGHMRFAIRPAGDRQTVDPGPILANWAQLQSALHPRGAKPADALLGATASDVFLMSRAQLERAVLSDPAIVLNTCSRHEVASGKIDRRVLAVLAFLSRSGLEPTVSGMRCSRRGYAAAGTVHHSGDELDISAINGIPIAGHQGPETITELTIRALLALPKGFVPHEIVSLMRFPGDPNTHASAADWNRIHLAFRRHSAGTALSALASRRAAHSARSGRTAPAPVVTTSALSAAQWGQLMQRVAALPAPSVATKPSSAAIPDPKRR